MTAELAYLSVPGWLELTGLVHRFYGRPGGTSAGAFAGLNLSESVGDDPAAVEENRRRVAAVLPGGSRLVWMRQEHGQRVLRVDEPVADAGAADGMVTAMPGAVLTILTADCVPILLVARRRRVAAVVHAGWRGTLAGIVTRAVELMQQEFGAERAELEAALGPAIGGCCYEVEREIGEQFVARWGALPEDGWRREGARGKFDLRAANRRLLEAAGLAAQGIHTVGPCTRCAGDRYFSHRGSGGRTGRQLSCIGWVA